jgi:hypothetical protein
MTNLDLGVMNNISIKENCVGIRIKVQLDIFNIQ